MITSGYPVAGTILGGATILGIIMAFIGGREYVLGKLARRGMPQDDAASPDADVASGPTTAPKPLNPPPSP